MKKNNILVWNCNQRAGQGRFYPKVVEDCLHKDHDIVILNEFYKYPDWEKLFNGSNYAYEESENGEGKNEILIAYDSDKYSLVREKYTWKSDYDGGYPDYLDIALKDAENNVFEVVGTRIVINSYNYMKPEEVNDEMKARARQGEKIAQRAADLKGVCIIGGGDMNTGRRNSQNDYWKKDIFADMMPEDIEVVLPDGYSHAPFYTRTSPDLLFHTKCMDIDVEPYNWKFVEDYKEDYPSGKVMKNRAGYPDHAQILAHFNLR